MKHLYALLTILSLSQFAQAQYSIPQQLLPKMTSNGRPIYFDGNSDMDYVFGNGYVHIDQGTTHSKMVDLHFNSRQIVVIADFNNDGFEDFIYDINTSGLEASYFLAINNAGQSITTSDISVTSINDPNSEVLIYDFNLDGNLDFLTISGVYLNDGAGHFSSALTLNLHSDLADIDGDGLLDVVSGEVENPDLNSWGWQKNLGNGSFSDLQSFQSEWVSLYAFGRAFLDLNGDILEDIVFRDQETAMISYCYNSGNGIFSPPVGIANFPSELMRNIGFFAYDMDLDGDEDFVHYTSMNFNDVYLEFGIVENTLDENPIFHNSVPAYVIQSDMNLQTVHFDNTHSSILLYTAGPSGVGNPLGFFEIPRATDFNFQLNLISSTDIAKFTHPGDFNNDGLTDFVWVSSIPIYNDSFDNVKHFFFQINGLPNGNFTAPILIGHDDDTSVQATGFGSTNFLVADMNNDGYDDFVAIGNSDIEEYYGSNLNSMSLTNSISTSSVFPTFFSLIGMLDFTLEQYYCASAVDLQGDGFPEIIIPDQGILSNNNGVLINYMNFANTGSSSYTLENVIEAQDIDNNGLMDLVLDVNLGGTTSIFYQTSIDSFEEATIPINIIGMNYGLKHKPFHDLNNDGLLDVIGYNNYSLSSGNNTYSAPLQLNSQVLDVRDENGDGYLDIIVTGVLNDYYSDPLVMINDGTGHFSSPSQLPQPSLSVFCHYDHDHDGDLDLFGYRGVPSSYPEFYLVENLSINMNPQLQINGTVFIDNNNNGTQENGELGLPNVNVIIEPQHIQIITNDQGQYNFNLSSEGTFTLHPIFDPSVYSAISPQSVTVSYSDALATVNFGATSAGPYSQFAINVSNSLSICNTDHTLFISVFNVGNTESTFDCDFVLPPNINFVSATNGGVFDGNNIVHWTGLTLAPNAVEQLSVVLHFPGSPFIGDSFTFSTAVQASDINGLATYSTNYVTYNMCAYDPNSIEETTGYTEHGYVAPSADLKYVIHFQNTGNDAATNVLLTAQLPTELDWTSLQFTGSSHNLTNLTIDENGLASFTFDNIQLPDSAADMLGSHGFVSFSIGLNDETPFFTPILNEANIFFDFNEPVLTNASHNEVFDCSNLGTIQTNDGGDCSAPTTDFSVDGIWISSYLWQVANGTIYTDSTLSLPNTSSVQEVNLIIDNDLCPAVSLNGIAASTPSLTITVIDNQLVSSAINTEYQWFWNGAPIANATNSTLSDLQYGTYFVELTANNGCVYESESITFQSVDEIGNVPVMEVYPVPTSNHVTIKFNNAQSSIITIRSSTGTLVLSEKITGTNLEMDVNDLSQGIYTVHCNGQTQKFVVVKD